MSFIVIKVSFIVIKGEFYRDNQIANVRKIVILLKMKCEENRDKSFYVRPILTPHILHGKIF